jgi:dTDP-4-amino-4,6-dideoxygalactose transaminase
MFKIGKEELDAVAQVITNGQFMRYRGGESGFTETFEKEVCDKFKVKHALTVNSGTSAFDPTLFTMLKDFVKSSFLILKNLLTIKIKK